MRDLRRENKTKAEREREVERERWRERGGERERWREGGGEREIEHSLCKVWTEFKAACL